MIIIAAGKRSSAATKEAGPIHTALVKGPGGPGLKIKSQKSRKPNVSTLFAMTLTSDSPETEKPKHLYLILVAALLFLYLVRTVRIN